MTFFMTEELRNEAQRRLFLLFLDEAHKKILTLHTSIQEFSAPLQLAPQQLTQNVTIPGVTDNNPKTPIMLELSTNKGTITVSSDSLISCAALGKNTQLRILEKNGSVTEMIGFQLLKDIEKLLTPDSTTLVRYHKSYILNTRLVESFEEKGCCIEVTMRGGGKAQVSKMQKKAFWDAMKKSAQ
ncbi:MAG: LytTR family transcriptional regulator [Candidatus Kapaibacterium sp.]|nr:MAG: LytTR family transcriptional regulator [Candidatus Kapabacteria bacterium]